MRTKLSLTILMLLFCLSVFGQQSINVPTTRKSSTTSTTKDDNLQQEMILKLKAENLDLQNRLKTMEENQAKMEKEIDYYRGDVRAKASEVNDNLSLWLSILGLLMVIFGALIPLYINYRGENRVKEMLKEVKDQAASAEKQSKESKEALEEIKSQVNVIKEQAIKAEKAAKDAKASQLFAQALKEQNPSTAIELYNQVIVLTPDDSYAYFNRGILKSEMKDDKGALADTHKAIELKPDFAEAYYHRGWLKNSMKDHMGAMADLDKAIELKPDFAEAYNGRGWVKYEMNDHKGAMADYDKAIELKPELTSVVYNNRAYIYMASEEFEKAINDVNKAIELDKDNLNYYDTRGEILLAMGKLNEALEDLNYVLSKNNDFVPSLDNRAKCYRKLAEEEQDEAKKADLIAKAEADEKEAESLKKKE